MIDRLERMKRMDVTVELKTIKMTDIRITDKIRLFPVRGRWEPWKKAVDALKKDINDPRFQYIFRPIRVNQLSRKSHLRTRTPPFMYEVCDGRKRTCCHLLLGLKTIKAYVFF